MRSGLCRPVKFILTKLPHPCLYGPCFVHWCSVMLEQEGASQSCSHKVGSMELSNISWYAEGFRVPYTGTEGPSPAPEKQPHTIIRPPPNFTLGSQTVTVLLATAKPRLVHQIVRWRSEIYHSRERVSTALESSGGTLTPLHPTLCIALADVRLGCSCLAMETHSMKLSTRCS